MIIPLGKTNSGCDYHRILLPARLAGIEGKVLTQVDKAELKILFFNRMLPYRDLQNIDRLKSEYNLKFALDVDDYWYLYPQHYLSKVWKESDVANRILHHIGLADIVFTATERLATRLRERHSNVHVIPNAIPFNLGEQFTFKRQPSAVVRFGFVGGSSHLEDSRQLIPVFQTYNQLPFIMAGYTEKNLDSPKMANIFSNFRSNRNFHTISTLPLTEYMIAYDNIDCCIAPLLDVEFNSYKSNLKVIEAGSKKCAIICSDNPCYTDTVPDTLVTFCKSVRDWKAAIKKHQDADYTKSAGEALYEWVKANYALENVNTKRFDLINTLYEKAGSA